MEVITSRQNPRFKEIKKLIEEKKTREKTGTFFVDGVNFVAQALANNWELEQLVFVPDEIDSDFKKKILGKVGVEKYFQISKELYESLATKDLIQGMGAVVAMKEGGVGERLMVVLENPKSPGNVGTIMRTMLGLGVTQLTIVQPAADIYQSECVRASMGAIFGIKCDLAENTADALAFCEKKGYEVVCFDRGESQIELKSLASTLSTKDRVALWFGSEGPGLSQEAKSAASRTVAIETNEKIDSLNLAEAVSIGLYTLLKL
jgi:TrmH family RNA methyltransferase